MSMEVIASLFSVIVAISALVFAMYSFRRQQDRADIYARASVKPLLSIKSQNYVDLKSIRIVNYGIGPAVIGKAEFRRGPEGKPTNNIIDLFNMEIKWWESFVNVPPNRAIPAEGEILLIKLSLAHVREEVRDEKEALMILNQWKSQKTGIFIRLEYEDIHGNKMPALEEILS